MNAKRVKLVAGVLSLSIVMGVATPGVKSLAAENPVASLVERNEESYVIDENNENYQNAITYLEQQGNARLVKYYKDYFYGKTVTADNKEELLDGFIAYLQSKPTSRIGLEVIIGIVAGAITIVKGLYEAGRYAAKQCVSRGILSKKDYKPNGGWIMAGITVAFGFPAALGFDDYMYDR